MANGHSKPTNQLSSNSAQRIRAHLQRDHPDVYEALERGEYRSTRAAGMPSQRGLIAARLATLKDGQRKVGKFAEVPTQSEAAKMLRVSERTIRNAGVVIDSGDAALIAACERGEKKRGRAVSELKRAERENESPASAEFASKSPGSTKRRSTP